MASIGREHVNAWEKATKDAGYRTTGKAARPVLVDAADWPGRLLHPWPPAEPGVPFAEPIGQGRGRKRPPEDAALASWLPIKTGLTPHGLRHGHKTWMAEDGIPEILQAERLGHEVPGMRGVYTHVSDGMRRELVEACRGVQRRWEEALRERAGITPCSPASWLDDLLKSCGERGEHVVSAPIRRLKPLEAEPGSGS